MPEITMKDLPLMVPPRSAWPALQAQLQRERRPALARRPAWVAFALAAGLACAVLIPRWARRESVFAEVGAQHLLRLPFNVLSHVWRTTAWSYLERSWFAWRAAFWLARRRGDARPVIYARDAVGAAWFGAGLARRIHQHFHPGASQGK